MKYFALSLLVLASCATTSDEILSEFKYSTSEESVIRADLKVCEVSAYNAGYTRRGGLVGDSGRVSHIKSCLEKKWKK